MNRNTQLVALLACSLSGFQEASAFVQSTSPLSTASSRRTSTITTQKQQQKQQLRTNLQMTMTDGFSDDDKTPLKSMKKKSLPRMSEAIPFLKRPPMLTGEMAGDFGFDPLNFAKDRDTLFYYREIEVKHARLAMLAAAGWPTSELLDRPIAAYFNIPSVLDDHDRVPSLLNGGLEKVRPEFWGFCLGLTAAIDSYQTQRSRSQIDYTPGDLGWDPLNFAKEGTESRAKLQLAEIQNGRLAMFGVTGFAVQEAVGHSAVVDETPVFFHPITETVEIILKGLVQ